jgi:hypothetical protein
MVGVPAAEKAQIGEAHIALHCRTRNQLPLCAQCNMFSVDGGGLPLDCHMLKNRGFRVDLSRCIKWAMSGAIQGSKHQSF